MCRRVSVAGNYESWVEPHLNDLRKYCFYLTKCKWDGEDLFQESILKAMIYFLNTAPYYNVKPFLILVARNLWIDNRRSLQRRQHHKEQGNRLYDLDADYA
jgi:RNA polymerase sigma-70 factor (ECF subfamily)